MNGQVLGGEQGAPVEGLPGQALDLPSAQGDRAVWPVSKMMSRVLTFKRFSYTATIGLFNPSLAEKRPTLAPTAEATASPTPAAEATATLVPAADATAPSPLSESHTGVTLEKGDCFDLDSGEVVTDERCDVHFNEYAGQMGLAAQNDALLSSNMRDNPPTRAECQAEVWLDVQVFFPPTGFYFCFQTNQGGHGFFVERDDQWERGRIVFDWWVFP